MRSRTPPISSEFLGGGWTPQTPPLGTSLRPLMLCSILCRISKTNIFQEVFTRKFLTLPFVLHFQLVTASHISLLEWSCINSYRIQCFTSVAVFSGINHGLTSEVRTLVKCLCFFIVGDYGVQPWLLLYFFKHYCDMHAWSDVVVKALRY